MYSIAAIESGFTPVGFSAHRDFEDRIYKSKPKVCDRFIVKYYKTYMDCTYNLNFGDKVIGFYAPLYAGSPHDIYKWLECICKGFRTSYYLLDEEGPEIMIRCNEDWPDEPYVRLTILSVEEKYYDEQNKKYVYNEKVEKIYNKTKKTQVIADYMIKKEQLITEFYRETNSYFESLTKEDYNGLGAVRRPAIPYMRKYLKELQNENKKY